ncbi:hypothetical protein LV79_003547 [Actinokineospora globicatena]|nr:hypothetical protein [Actinokineospora globicatena]MCP2303842.1 hypothetical protein [Actinokineospora globicatena]GLW79002.1 hypothetical protein Aglo01_34840 [Actinokineospora globicatena]GLW86587.1 hypothetical protein Aglo02_42260 [Actinokineospora globicatena]
MAHIAIPSDDEFATTFGVASRSVDGEDAVRQIVLESGRDVVTLVADLPGASVRLVWRRDDVVLLDLFREAVEQVAIVDEDGATRLVATSALAGYRGELIIQIFPRVRVEDRQLIV